MDKKLNRQILYVKPTSQKCDGKKMDSISIDELNTFENISQSPELKFKAPLKKTEAKDIIKWIKEHPYFKWSSMCVDLKIDKGNFQRILKAKEPSIKQEQVLLIEQKIKEYGY